MRLIFVRHGEPVAILLHEFSNRGWKDPPTETGRQQAEILARRLARSGLTRIYTSPLMRAVQTAEILSQTLKVPFEINDALREYDVGDYEGALGSIRLGAVPRSGPCLAAWRVGPAHAGRGELQRDPRTFPAFYYHAGRKIRCQRGGDPPDWARRVVPHHAAGSPG